MLECSWRAPLASERNTHWIVIRYPAINLLQCLI